MDSSMSLQTRQEQAPMRVRGLHVGLEPAFITSWESGKLYAPPGLAPDESIMRCPDAERLPSKVSLSQPGLRDAVGTRLRKAAAYIPQSERHRTHRPAHNQQVLKQNVMSDAPQKQRRHQKRRCFLLIATQLRQLEEEDPRKLLVVRKINRLGFDSADILQEYFGQFGTVSKVLLSNKHEKQPGSPFPVRLRPSGIGYVLFDTVEGAAQALAKGAVQVVNGVEIAIRAFEKRQVSKEMGNASDAEDCVDAECGGHDISSSASEQAVKDD
mmetsp:Transcript_121955/g.210851  ORF Transcript_121955/g.210851 Transcript_121955/m.210851 type:complete len:269 (+) Transcript_121955:40-846(+)